MFYNLLGIYRQSHRTTIDVLCVYTAYVLNYLL